MRVIGVAPRESELWKELYSKRQGIERFFGSAKQSRLLDLHQYLHMDKIRAHVALSMLTYLATVFGNLMAGNAEKMRHMRLSREEM